VTPRHLGIKYAKKGKRKERKTKTGELEETRLFLSDVLKI
jgi:hypothetical protein